IPSNAVKNNVHPPRTTKALSNSPTPIDTFNGVMDNNTLIPPDIQGAAGPVYIMETTNQEFRIMQKNGTLQSTVDITTFFSATNGSGYFDPHVYYDPHYGGRFVA